MKWIQLDSNQKSKKDTIMYTMKRHKKTRMHSSRMCTVRNSSRLLSGGSPHPRSRHPPQSRPPRTDPPKEQTSLGAHLPRCKACWDTTCNACWDSTPLPVNRITDTCKNITFVADGNKYKKIKLKACSHGAKAKKIKEQPKEIKEKISNTKENFHFRVRFRSVWMNP